MGNATLTAASGTWTKPAGCYNLVAKVYGGGGGGGSSSLTKSDGAGAGGGGGAFTKITIASPDASYDYVVGTAGTGGAGGTGVSTDGGTGGFSWFGSVTTCYSKGGGGGAKGVAAGSATAGIAGTADYGDVMWNGGAGYLGASGATDGGGGGGSGGTGSAGNSATSSTGAVAVTGGYNGGNGGAAHTAGSSPTDAYGGGGGGGGHTNTNNLGVAGADGKPGVILLTWDEKHAVYDDNSPNLTATFAKVFLGMVLLAGSSNEIGAGENQFLDDARIEKTTAATPLTPWANTDDASTDQNDLISSWSPSWSSSSDDASLGESDITASWSPGWSQPYSTGEPTDSTQISLGIVCSPYDTNADTWSDLASRALWGYTVRYQDGASHYLGEIAGPGIPIQVWDNQASEYADTIQPWGESWSSSSSDHSADYADLSNTFAAGRSSVESDQSENYSDQIAAASKYLVAVQSDQSENYLDQAVLDAKHFASVQSDQSGNYSDLGISSAQGAVGVQSDQSGNYDDQAAIFGAGAIRIQVESDQSGDYADEVSIIGRSSLAVQSDQSANYSDVVSLIGLSRFSVQSDQSGNYSDLASSFGTGSVRVQSDQSENYADLAASFGSGLAGVQSDQSGNYADLPADFSPGAISVQSNQSANYSDQAAVIGISKFSVESDQSGNYADIANASGLICASAESDQSAEYADEAAGWSTGATSATDDHSTAYSDFADSYSRHPHWLDSVEKSLPDIGLFPLQIPAYSDGSAQYADNAASYGAARSSVFSDNSSQYQDNASSFGQGMCAVPESAVSYADIIAPFQYLYNISVDDFSFFDYDWYVATFQNLYARVTEDDNSATLSDIISAWSPGATKAVDDQSGSYDDWAKKELPVVGTTPLYVPAYSEAVAQQDTINSWSPSWSSVPESAVAYEDIGASFGSGWCSVPESAVSYADLSASHGNGYCSVPESEVSYQDNSLSWSKGYSQAYDDESSSYDDWIKSAGVSFPIVSPAYSDQSAAYGDTADKSIKIVLSPYDDNSTNLTDSVSKRSRRWQDSVSVLRVVLTELIVPIPVSPEADRLDLTLNDTAVDIDAQYCVEVEDEAAAWTDYCPPPYLSTITTPIAPEGIGSDNSASWNDDVSKSLLTPLWVSDANSDNSASWDDDVIAPCVDATGMLFVSGPNSDNGSTWNDDSRNYRGVIYNYYITGPGSDNGPSCNDDVQVQLHEKISVQPYSEILDCVDNAQVVITTQYAASSDAPVWDDWSEKDQGFEAIPAKASSGYYPDLLDEVNNFGKLFVSISETEPSWLDRGHIPGETEEMVVLAHSHISPMDSVLIRHHSPYGVHHKWIIKRGHHER